MHLTGESKVTSYYVYILANRKYGTLYVGMTNDIARRAFEHRSNAIDGFTKQYNVHRLIHIETFAAARDAIQREKNLKHWSRAWKVQLIEKENPDWRDLYEDLNK